MVDSCRKCESCKAGEEQLCEKGSTFTYNSEDKKGGGVTYGGYSESVVVDQDFRRARAKEPGFGPPPRPCSALALPRIRRCGFHKVGKGQKVGIVGLGGLGHMGVKLAKAFGAKVTVLHHFRQQDPRMPNGWARPVVLSTER